MTNLEAAITVLARHREERHWADAEVAADLMVVLAVDPEGDNAWAAAHPPAEVPTAPPVSVDVPYAEQQGDLLTCTMGNWQNEPTGYAYQWKRDGTTDIGTGASYTVVADDVDHTVTCVVTASNSIGTTEAPPSNGVVVVAPAGDAAAAAAHQPTRAEARAAHRAEANQDDAKRR